MYLSEIKKRAIKLLVFSDFLTATLAWVIFWAIRHKILLQTNFGKAFTFMRPIDFIEGFILLPLAWLFLYYLAGTYFDLYRKSRINEVYRTFISCTIGSLLLSFVLVSNDSNEFSYFFSMSCRYFFIHTSLTLLFRMVILFRVKRKITSGQVGFNTMIVGGNQQAIQIYKQITENNKILGNIFKGFIYSQKETGNGMSHYLPQLGDLTQLESIIDTHQIEEVIVAVDSSERRLLENILTRLSYKAVVVKVLPNLYDIISGSVKTNNVYDTILVHIEPVLMPDWQIVCKRAIDIAASFTAIILLSPIYIFAAIRVKLSSPGSIFYKQERIGLYGISFNIIKFRSMCVAAEESGPALSKQNDPRITSWGRVMRKWRIDEIPQFYNILIGDMSLVGPRPERKYYIDIICTTHPHYKYLHKVKPGLTSWGMVKYGYAENVEQMKKRMEYDLLYIENCSLALDIKIMLHTFIVIVEGRGK
ncbi:MAG: sugar transferase [Phycisphaerales bacterium]|nr:sugar transferase [Phycisphaerales bacterium]